MRTSISFLVSLCLSGCVATTRGSGTGKCKSNSDCAADQVCNAKGFCQTTFGCHANADCGANRTCDTTSGICLCANDQGCVSDAGIAQFCNPNNRCQSYGACEANPDCPTGKICNTLAHTCIPSGNCGGTIQCPVGEVCDPAQNACVAGCKDSGDCPQTAVGANGIYFDPHACINGKCVGGGACVATIGCPFNDFCTNSTCVSSCSQGPYCTPCGPYAANPTCSGTNSLCIVDDRDDPSCNSILPPTNCKYWCGVDCSGGKPCPAGFSCYDIVQNPSCGCPSTCSNGTACQCIEGATSGTCACTADRDCSVPGSNVKCVNGECLVAQNCFPDKGLYCDAPGPGCP